MVLGTHAVRRSPQGLSLPSCEVGAATVAQGVPGRVLRAINSGLSVQQTIGNISDGKTACSSVRDHLGE